MVEIADLDPYRGHGLHQEGVRDPGVVHRRLAALLTLASAGSRRSPSSPRHLLHCAGFIGMKAATKANVRTAEAGARAAATGLAWPSTAGR